MEPKTIGQRIRYYRNLKKLRQVDLAEILDVKKSTVSMWESDASSPVVERIWPICQALDITPSILLGYNENDENYIDEISLEEDRLITIYREVSKPAKGLIMSHAESVKKYDTEILETEKEQEEVTDIEEKPEGYYDDFPLLAAHGTEGMTKEELDEVMDMARDARVLLRKKKAEMEND